MCRSFVTYILDNTLLTCLFSFGIHIWQHILGMSLLTGIFDNTLLTILVLLTWLQMTPPRITISMRRSLLTYVLDNTLLICLFVQVSFDIHTWQYTIDMSLLFWHTYWAVTVQPKTWVIWSLLMCQHTNARDAEPLSTFQHCVTTQERRAPTMHPTYLVDRSTLTLRTSACAYDYDTQEWGLLTIYSTAGYGNNANFGLIMSTHMLVHRATRRNQLSGSSTR